MLNGSSRTSTSHTGVCAASGSMASIAAAKTSCPATITGRRPIRSASRGETRLVAVTTADIGTNISPAVIPDIPRSCW